MDLDPLKKKKKKKRKGQQNDDDRYVWLLTMLYYCQIQ